MARAPYLKLIVLRVLVGSHREYKMEKRVKKFVETPKETTGIRVAFIGNFKPDLFNKQLTMLAVINIMNRYVFKILV